MKSIQTDGAPAAIGPYSQAITANGFIFTAGQIPLDPVSGKIVGKDIAEQTRQVMKNLEQVLAAGKSDFSKVVETLIFCTDLSDFSIINSVYSEFMGPYKPARSTVQVAALPKSVAIEIRMVAVCSPEE